MTDEPTNEQLDEELHDAVALSDALLLAISELRDNARPQVFVTALAIALCRLMPGHEMQHGIIDLAGSIVSSLEDEDN